MGQNLTASKIIKKSHYVLKNKIGISKKSILLMLAGLMHKKIGLGWKECQEQTL